MLSTSRIAASAVLGLGLVTACASTTESTAPSNVDVQAFSAAQCDFVLRCQPLALATIFGTRDACVSELAASITPELALKGVSLSEAEAQACQTKYAGHACDDPSTPAECAFKGTLADGAPCASTLQCSSGNCDLAASTDSTSAACGTCKPFAGVGEDCTDANCAEGLRCSSAHKCVAGVAEGVACTDPSECSGSLQCVAGKCAPLFAEGAACKPTTTAAGSCNGNVGLYCKPTIADGSAGVCAKYAFANVGEACGIDRTTFIATLCTGAQCDATSALPTGKCIPFVADGAACSDTTAACAFGLGCTAGVCKRTERTTCNP